MVLYRISNFIVLTQWRSRQERRKQTRPWLRYMGEIRTTGWSVVHIRDSLFLLKVNIMLHALFIQQDLERLSPGFATPYAMTKWRILKIYGWDTRGILTQDSSALPIACSSCSCSFQLLLLLLLTLLLLLCKILINDLYIIIGI